MLVNNVLFVFFVCAAILGARTPVDIYVLIINADSTKRPLLIVSVTRNLQVCVYFRILLIIDSVNYNIASIRSLSDT